MRTKVKTRRADDRKESGTNKKKAPHRRRPKRAQCEIDLETLDFQRQGFSMREIAKKQRVHLNTVFTRVQRARTAEQARLQEELQNETPLSAAQRTQEELVKLRQLERAFWPRAAGGDIQALWGVMRVMRECRGLAESKSQAPAPAQGEQGRLQHRTNHGGGNADHRRHPEPPKHPHAPRDTSHIVDPWKFLFRRADTGDWNYYIDALPHHHDLFISLRDELRGVEIQRERERQRILAGPRARPDDPTAADMSPGSTPNAQADSAGVATPSTATATPSAAAATPSSAATPSPAATRDLSTSGAGGNSAGEEPSLALRASVEELPSDGDAEEMIEVWKVMPDGRVKLALVPRHTVSRVSSATAAGGTKRSVAPRQGDSRASGTPAHRGETRAWLSREHSGPDKRPGHGAIAEQNRRPVGQGGPPDPRPAKDPAERARQLATAEAFAKEQDAWLVERKATFRAKDKLRAEQLAAARAARQQRVAAARVRREQSANTCANAKQALSAEKPSSMPQQPPRFPCPKLTHPQ